MSLWMTTSYSSSPSNVLGKPSVGCSTGHARSPVSGSASTVLSIWPLLPNCRYRTLTTMRLSDWRASLRYFHSGCGLLFCWGVPSM